jgi:glutamyl-tRNA reductase
VRIVVVGLSHKTAPVELREKLSLYGRSPLDMLHGLRDATYLRECAVLSTCNRTEVYGITEEEDWQEQILAFLARQGGVSSGFLQDHLYSYDRTPAMRHLFRVSAGLDSMVVGEGQILSQVKETLQTARDAGTAGSILHTLFQYAITLGKRARTETEIGKGAVSVSLAAVQLARQIFSRLDGREVLLIGAGEMGEQTAKMLLSAHAPSGEGPKLRVCNRTLERAEALASQFGGTAWPYEKLADALARADIVITSTGSREPVITVEQMRRVMRARRGRGLFLIDIAVPRDVEPGISELDDVYLYNIDDLQEVVEKSLAGRQAEATRVEALIDEDLRKFQTWLRGLEVSPTIQQIQQLKERIIAGELQRAGGKLSDLSPEQREAVDVLVRSVANKLVLPTIIHLKEAADSGNGYHEVENMRTIFRLNQETNAADPAGSEETAP